LIKITAKNAKSYCQIQKRYCQILAELPPILGPELQHFLTLICSAALHYSGIKRLAWSLRHSNYGKFRYAHFPNHFKVKLLAATKRKTSCGQM
jgi:hypothetical protein